MTKIVPDPNLEHLIDAGKTQLGVAGLLAHLDDTSVHSPTRLPGKPCTFGGLPNSFMNYPTIGLIGAYGRDWRRAHDGSGLR